MRLKRMRLIEFSLNDIIQQIQWIMAESKSGMVTRGIYPSGNKHITSFSNTECISIATSE